MTDISTPWWYLSFTDPEIAATIPEHERRPGGPSWLGGCYVQGADEAAAVTASHMLGCNPGGEVGIMGPITADMSSAFDANVPPENRNRLLVESEINP